MNNLKEFFKKSKPNKYVVLYIFGIIVFGLIVYGVVNVFALDESTWRVGDGQNTQLITGSSDNVVISSTNVKLGKDNLWLDLDWDYKRNIEIKNITSNILPQGDTITISVNTSALESIQDSCNDLRIGYIVNNEIVELPRSIQLGKGSTNCNDSIDTKVSFKLQNELTHSGVEGYVEGDEFDSNYVIFYGNDTVGDTAPISIGDKNLYFDGTDDIINLGDQTLPFTSGANTLYSVSFWVRPDATFDYGLYKTILGSLSSAWNAVYFTNTTTLRIATAGGVGSGTTWTIDNVNNGSWHHFVLIVDSANSYSELYQNGVSKGVKNIQFYSSRTQEYIGGQNAANTYFKGNLDSIYYYNSVLTSEDIQTLYNGKLPSKTMYLGYNFDEGTGQDVLDISGNNRNKFLGTTNQVQTSDPTRNSGISRIFDVNSLGSTLFCPLGVTTNCLGNVTPSTSSGAIKNNAGGSALILDGFNDYVDTPNITLSEFTFSAWVKSDYRGGDINRLQNITNGSGMFYYLSLQYGVLKVYDGADWRVANTTIPNNTWGHVVMSYRGSDKQLKLYVNGNLAYSSSGLGTYTNGILRELGRVNPTDRRFLGAMDYVRLDNRVLSDIEISSLYNGGNPNIVGPSDSTILLYYLDENGLDSRLSSTKTSLQTSFGVTGDYVAYDASGNGNHGLVIGAKYTNDTPLGNSGVMSHEGTLVEEATTNKVLNPSFENTVFDKYWSKGYENLNTGSATFTAKMAKRNSAGPFASGVTVQGNDFLTIPSGDLISNLFYQNMDYNQGSVSFWITPSWNGNDGQIHDIFIGNGIRISKWSDNNIYVRAGSTGTYLGAVNVSSWTAGSTYNVVVSWDKNKTIDDTNYVRVSINGVNSYIRNTALPTLTASSYQITGDAIIEGLTVYRRVLFDGTYGVNVGNGNEISQIYNSGTGKDPSEITGSWDIVFALPTDGATGELTSTNQAWSMPHSTNLLGVGGFLSNSNYSTDGFNKYSNNQLLNSSFENNLDNWNYTQEYILRDEFNDTLPTTLASGGVSNPVPTLSSELLVDGGFENWITNNNLTSWAEFTSDASINREQSDVVSGSSATRIDVGPTGNAFIQQVNATVVGNWYRSSITAKSIPEGASLTLMGSLPVLTANYQDIVLIGRSPNANVTYQRTGNSANKSIYIDDASIKQLTLSSLFSSVSVPSSTDYTVQSNVTLTTGTQAGVVVSLDSNTTPNNFVIAYHDGTFARLEKNVNGTYTTLINIGTTYVAGAPIKVVKNGNSYTMFYNNTLVGTTQTISDASIINNTRHGVFSTYASNSFTNFEVKGGINGTLATDGVNNRILRDSNGYASISEGGFKLSSVKDAYDPWFGFNGTSRTLGKTLITKKTSNTTALFQGFTSSAYNATSNLYGYSDSLGIYDHSVRIITEQGTNPNQLAISLRNAGAYYFIKNNGDTNWKLMYGTSTGTESTLLPAFSPQSNGVGTLNMDYMKIPAKAYLPIPIAYDTFTRANGSIGSTETTGPDGQTTNQLSWSGSAASIDTGKLKIMPTIGTELVADTSFDDPGYWTTSGGTTISGSMANFPAVNANISRAGIFDLSKWYVLEYASSNLSSGCIILPTAAQNYRYSANGTSISIFKPSSTTFTFQRGCSPTTTFTLDSISIKELNNVSQLFATVNTNTPSIIMDINMIFTDLRPAGLVFNLDSESNPQNYIYAQYGGSSNTTTAIYKVVNGVPTLLTTGGAGYVANAPVRIITDNSTPGSLKIKMYYNNVLQGSEVTVTDTSIINNTRHGIFSTYEGNTFDNFTIFPRGTSGEYNNIPAEDLTVYRDTSRTYSGVSSAKLISGGNHAPFTQTKTLGNTTYELSTYVYKDGSAITVDDIVLYYNSNIVNTTYESVGSGWYRIYGNITGTGNSKEVGVLVKANKSLNIDQIELKQSQDQINVSDISSNNRIFNSGYTVNSDNGSGIYKDINITTGQDIVIRGIGHSDGTSIPKLSVYDVTNDIEIGSLIGTTASTKNAPDNLLFTAEGTLASKSTGTITLTNNPTNGDLLEIGGIIYEFTTDITSPAAGEILVLIGADSTATSTNLTNAIMGGAGLNTTYSYGTGSVAHTSVNATSSTNIVTIESKTTGKINNNITLSEVGNSTTISSNALIGGRDNSSTLRIRLLNNSNTISSVNWHQVEVYSNLVDNPSFERGSYNADNNWLPTGWVLGNWTAGEGYTNQDTTDKRSGNNSLFAELVNGSYYYPQYVSTSDSVKYISAGFHARADAISNINHSITVSPSYGLGGNQSGASTNLYSSARIVSPNTSWKRGDVVARMNNSGSSSKTFHIYFGTNHTSGQFNIDDLYRFNLSDVSLSLTPSSLVNSQSNGGVIVNGLDTYSVPLNMTNPNNGVIRFDYTPTWTNPSIHTSDPMYIVDTDSGSRISLYYSGTTYALVINGNSVTNTSLVLNKGQRYSFEIAYNANGTSYLKIDGTIVASTTGFTGFTTTGPTTLYLGSRNDNIRQMDGTFYPFTASTVSSSTDASYVKFGTKSVNIVTTTASDDYVTELNLGTNYHHVSAYVYNNTTGSVGGTVDSSVAQIIFNGVPVTSTYVDEGGGWWRVYYKAIGISGNAKYGIQVKANKNVYVDGFMVNDLGDQFQTGVRRYFDGGLGTGYAWSGTPNESTSVRTAGSLQYTNIPINTTNNSVSFWMKLETPISDVSGSTIFTLGGYTVSRNPSGNAHNFRFYHTNGSDIRYNPGFNNTDWYFITITDAPSSSPIFYINGTPYTTIAWQNGIQPPDNIYTSPATLSIGASSTLISNLRIFNTTLTQDQIMQLYNQGMNTYSVGNSNNGKYATEGTWTSQVIDLGNNGQWGASPSLSITDNKGSDNIIYRTRTSPNNVDWSDYQNVVSVTGGYNFASPANRYMQIQALLQSSNQTTTPEFNGMQFNYVMDTVKPSVNASDVRYYNQVEAGQLQTPNDWTRFDSPYISWTAGEDNLDGSGLRGYCLYLGQDINADPANDSGLLSTTSPVHTSDTNCEFIIGTNSIDLSNVAYRGDNWMTSSNNPYYFKIKAVDLTGNVYGDGAVDAMTYTFKLDNTDPNNPKGISAPQSYQRELTSFRIFWADTGPSVATDTHSGIKGYQYRIGEDGIWYGSGHTGDQDCNDLITTTSYTLQELFEGKDYGDELSVGSNVFYIRTWDNICNVTDVYSTAILQYSADAPSSPTNLSVDPSVNVQNAFSFSWAKPDTFSGQESGLSYCYTVNAFPSTTRCNWTNATSLSEDAYANQPGENIFYVVAKDEAGNINYGDYTTIKFTANTSAPGIVQNLEISDVSIKSTAKWRLALSWDIPEEIGAGVASYRIYRSSDANSNYTTNPNSFTQVGTTSGESFTDVNLNATEYFYAIKACDSANNCSAASNTVSMLPTGRYYSPANIITQPNVSKVSTRSATINWVTERESDSKIAYGLNPGEYFDEEISNSDQTVDHALTLNNLTAGTTYYYVAKWTDEDGNTGMTDELSFKTDPPPSVKDVGLSFVNLSSAGIKFTTKGASKVKIYYGKDASLNSSLDLETSPVETSYTMTLTGLEDGTKYLYKINLFDIDNNEYDGTVLLDFTTPPRPRISNVQIQEKKGTAQPTLEITWESNTEVNSIIRFFPVGREDLAQNRVDIEMIKGKHTMLLNGLLPMTTYNLKVEGTDKYGNSGSSELFTFTTATDTRAPEIFDVKIDKAILSSDAQPDRSRSAQLVISWKTDEPATSQVEYDSGLGDSYSQKSNMEPNIKVDHVVVINNLNPSTVYHVRAISTDAAENISTGNKMVAVTPKATNTVFEVVAESLGNIFKFLK